MSVNVVVHDDVVEVQVGGAWDQMLCFTKGLTLPLADIAGARLAGWNEIRPDLGLRVAGGYWPGMFATGTYTWKDRKGLRQFLAVFRSGMKEQEPILVIDTRLERPARIVIQSDDRERLAWWINERVSAGAWPPHPR